MAHIITVHQEGNGSEILINADQIVQAERISDPRGNYTNLKLRDTHSIPIRESLEDLKQLCRV